MHVKFRRFHVEATGIGSVCGVYRGICCVLKGVEG